MFLASPGAKPVAVHWRKCWRKQSVFRGHLLELAFQAEIRDEYGDVETTEMIDVRFKRREHVADEDIVRELGHRRSVERPDGRERSLAAGERADPIPPLLEFLYDVFSEKSRGAGDQRFLHRFESLLTRPTAGRT